MIHVASMICYPGVLHRMSTIVGGDYYLIPSSIHEMIFMRIDNAIDPKDLLKMVKTVNCEVVAEGDILADSLYFYDSKHDELRVL